MVCFLNKKVAQKVYFQEKMVMEVVKFCDLHPIISTQLEVLSH